MVSHINQMVSDLFTAHVLAEKVGKRIGFPGFLSPDSDARSSQIKDQPSKLSVSKPRLN